MSARRPLVHHESVYDEHVRGRVLIYLDNNVWIDLVEGRSEEDRACRRACEAAVEDGHALFPLTGASIEELLDQPPEAHPARQADLMDYLSQRVCFRAGKHVWEHEARGVLDVFPARGVVIPDRRSLFTYVIEYLADASIVFQPSWSSTHVTQLKEHVRRAAATEIGVRWMLDHLPVDAMRARHQEGERRYVEAMQRRIAESSAHFRRGGKLIRDRVLLEERLWAIKEYVQPAVRAEANRRRGMEAALEFFREGRRLFGDGSPARLDTLMLSLPSLDMMCELMAHRTMNPGRRVQREDMLDNEHAMVAPAYSDVFFTKDRNLFDLLARRCKVPSRRRCRVIRSARQLIVLLQAGAEAADIGERPS